MVRLRFQTPFIASVSASCFDLSPGSAVGVAGHQLLISCSSLFCDQILVFLATLLSHSSDEFSRPKYGNQWWALNSRGILQFSSTNVFGYIHIWFAF